MQMLEIGDQLRFRLETADEVGLVGVLGQNDLDRHIPVNELLPGAVNSSVSALTEVFQQLVAFDRAGT